MTPWNAMVPGPTMFVDQGDRVTIRLAKGRAGAKVTDLETEEAR